MTAQPVLLFDIDGTLIDPRSTGKEAFFQGIRECTGIEPSSKISFAGKTDYMIINEIFPDGLSQNQQKEIYQSYLRLLPEYFTQKNGVSLLPGVTLLLKELSNMEIPMGLVTGNMEEGAWTKLEYFGIGKYFYFGSFGDRAQNRNELACNALVKAKMILGRTINPDQVILIGDTPADITSALYCGYKSVAVSTGKYSSDELIQYNPDILLDDLNSSEVLLNYIENENINSAISPGNILHN